MTTKKTIEPRLSNLLIVIGGPTAAGKTSLALRLAKRLGAEIISADSRQIFKELKIGSAQPSEQELSLVPHHFVGTHSILNHYDAGQFETDALTVLDELFKKNPVQIMAGGSGLYLNAVMKGFDPMPPVNQALRSELQAIFSRHGLAYMCEMLLAKDPLYHTKAELSNPRRVLRALEICYSGPETYSSYRQGMLNERPFKTLRFCLNPERTELYKAIDQRTDSMIAFGLVEEAEKWYPYRHLNALQTVGYRELYAFMANSYSLDKAVELIKQHTRNFAKRQLTWFRSQEGFTWVEPRLSEDTVLKHINQLQ